MNPGNAPVSPFSFRRSFGLILVLALGTCGARMAWAAEAPRERVRMDFGWRFHLGDAPDADHRFDYAEARDLAKTRLDELGKEGASGTPPATDLGSDVSFVQASFDDRGWCPLDLPHDWAVDLPFEPQADFKHGFKPLGRNYPQNSIGWYRREFQLPASDQGKALWLEFDGVYRHSLVWLNGHCLGRHLSGYTGFRYAINPFANFGGTNHLVVRVDASRFEGWFYEGAGIYRHVWLEKTGLLRVVPEGIFVSSKLENGRAGARAKVTIQTVLRNAANRETPCTLASAIVDAEGKTVAALQQRTSVRQQQTLTQTLTVENPALWSPESPKLYKLITTIQSEGTIADREETEFGIRTVAFDAHRGFLLNGKPYTIKGTCNHQDHAGVGAAIPDALQYFRVRKLKEMGCNALRTSHNAPTPELVQACDRLGLLVMDENRRMDANDFTLGELENLILRDRNHPSVFIWSLGNEEPFLQGTDAGTRVAATMQKAAHQLDPTRLCTVAMNGNWGEGVSKVIDVQGFNYATKKIDAYHVKYLLQPEVGTETASTIGTRGIYANDPARGYVSALGDEHPRWGAKPWEWWPYYATHPFTSGGFVWTGFDYRGEPTPYKWPCISSHFGIMDTCGFPKDIYYYYQSWWTDKPVLHIAPHWNWPGKEGQTNVVRVFSNCHQVELFLNGTSLGQKTLQTYGYLHWDVAYVPGVLSAQGRSHGNLVAETKVETTGAPFSIQLTPDCSRLHADRRDVSVLTVAVLDAQGCVVPTADNLIHFELSGPGTILGVGNGDPSSHEPDKANQRSVFNGLAQVLVQSTAESGVIRLIAASPGLRATTTEIRSEPSSP